MGDNEQGKTWEFKEQLAMALRCSKYPALVKEPLLQMVEAEADRCMHDGTFDKAKAEQLEKRFDDTVYSMPSRYTDDPNLGFTRKYLDCYLRAVEASKPRKERRHYAICLMMRQ